MASLPARRARLHLGRVDDNSAERLDSLAFAEQAQPLCEPVLNASLEGIGIGQLA